MGSSYKEKKSRFQPSMLTYVNSPRLNQSGWRPRSVLFTIMAIPIEEEATIRAVVFPSECAVPVVHAFLLPPEPGKHSRMLRAEKKLFTMMRQVRESRGDCEVARRTRDYEVARRTM